MARYWSRRLFLHGVAGAAVAAPFLSSVAERHAKAQGMPPAGPPRRLIVMFTHYGCLTNRLFPVKSNGELTSADYSATNLAPLAEFAPKLLMVRGVRAMNQWHANNRSQQTALGQGNDPHTQVVGSYFTCEPVTPNTNNPFDLNNTAAKFNALPMGPSLDHVIAKQLSSSGSPLFMRVSGTRDNNQTGISFEAAETPFPGLDRASQVYSSLTGLFGSGGGDVVTPADYQAVRGQSVIDLVRDDLDTLARQDMSAADRQKLEAWKELLHSMGTTVTQAITQQCDANMAAALGLNSQTTAGGGGGIGGDPVAGKINDTMDGADVFSALATLAAVCNANPVIFLKYPGNYVFRALSTEGGRAIDLENHSLSHRIGDAGQGGKDCRDGVMDMLDAIDQFYVRKFAKLVGMLDGIPEGDGKLLDNSATIWFQEMSDGNAHNLNNLPIIQAGSCGGYFKTGQAINVDGGAADLSKGNSDKYCNGDNFVPTAEVDTTGTPEGTAEAPINKYYCNIMNALGVKAGPDGFPAEGGTEEVTHYGRYDNTADFFGGGTNPPKINNPGEYAELKANS